jgi:uncharacterized membrane protein YkvA (DUF1232 family)
MNPLKSLLHRCTQGFTLGQKLLATMLVLIYLISPIDLCPDFVPIAGFGDDLYVLYLGIRVWCSPTLAPNPPPLMV